MILETACDKRLCILPLSPSGKTNTLKTFLTVALLKMSPWEKIGKGLYADAGGRQPNVAPGRISLYPLALTPHHVAPSLPSLPRGSCFQIAGRPGLIKGHKSYFGTTVNFLFFFLPWKCSNDSFQERYSLWRRQLPLSLARQAGREGGTALDSGENRNHHSPLFL